MLKNAIVAFGVALVVAAAGSAVARPTDAQKCSSKMRKCAGKLFFACTKCHAKEALTGDTAATAECIAKATDKYDACQAKLIGNGGCLFGDGIVDHIQDEILNSWCPDVVFETPES
jgi:hypothetical protein